MVPIVRRCPKHRLYSIE